MSKLSQPTTPAIDYEEERIPFDQVLRKLVSSPPAHKSAKPTPAKKTPKPKKG